jgi:hypothetical protein
MAKEKLYAGVDNEFYELKGEELETVIAEQKLVQDNYATAKQAEEERKSARLSALQKLGLTEEEINAVL